MGDRLLVKPGEVVPVDGIVIGAAATLDESALTGEARLVTREAGDPVSSGTVNAGAPFDLVATATAEHSTYAGIVRLVEEAQSSKAPFVRLADRYALLFVPLTLVIAGFAWITSGDPVRALSVLVVATPCPLLLAAPIAIVAGISRSAKRGIIVKGGGALEAIARARVLLFDKTGTLTAGRPHLADVVAAPDRTPGGGAPLRGLAGAGLAARPRGVDRGRRPRARRCPRPPRGGRGDPGRRDHRARGRARRARRHRRLRHRGAPLPAWARDVRRRVNLEGATGVYVGVDGVLVGALVLDDPIRPETPRVIRSLRRAGIRRMVMVTGDHYGVADIVAAAIGVDAVLAERTPADKVDAVAQEKAEADGILVMVGDGINDAPALATADVGVAMGARGATASSEAADLVITVDRLDRLPEAIRIARRARSIALQSVIAGMAMSLVAMLVATTGVLPPVDGAMIQEAIDVIVILNALRALSGGTERRPRCPAGRSCPRACATSTGSSRPPWRASGPWLTAWARCRRRRRAWSWSGPGPSSSTSLIPHEEEEDRDVFPFLAKAVGNDDVTAALHRTHTEIFHLIRFIDRLVAEVPPEGPGPEDLTDLRRVLYGLDAILRLHMAQEEELYLALGDEHPEAPSRSCSARRGTRGRGRRRPPVISRRARRSRPRRGSHTSGGACGGRPRTS